MIESGWGANIPRGESMTRLRYALYVTLPSQTPLARFGAAALGYECEGGRVVPQAIPEGLDPGAAATAAVAPSQYGFHATIVAPFRLAPRLAETDLVAALRSFAAGRAPCSAGRLRVALLSRFVALVPRAPSPEESAFAADCLAAFDRCRAPLSATERERRIAAGLSARQAALLDRWGYPYVLDEFRFHMTLAGPIPPADGEAWLAAYRAAFFPLAQDTLVVDALSLLRQDDASARFHLIRREPLTG
jgi:hypothetical protein